MEFKEGNGLLKARMFLERCYDMTQSIAKQSKALPKIRDFSWDVICRKPFFFQCVDAEKISTLALFR